MKTERFDFTLPDDLIAQRPQALRDQSRLMTLNRHGGARDHLTFSHFPTLLRSGDLLVLNDTKVFAARLYGRRFSGGKIELLLLHPTAKAGVWEALIRGRGKLTTGEEIIIGKGRATLISKLPHGTALVDFGSRQQLDSLIKSVGEVPLPPYIHRPNGQCDDNDRLRYQTIYATHEGSCAAPTAGLHFTHPILQQIEEAGVTIATVTLHVGPGTFRPISTEEINDHVMDYEWYSISAKTADAVRRTKQEGGRVVAVGSTVTRTLEAAALASGSVTSATSSTNLFITPTFTFQVVDALLTNFHLPKSSLMVLVSAFANEEIIRTAYADAIEKRYRFFSYGDCMFIA